MAAARTCSSISGLAPGTGVREFDKVSTDGEPRWDSVTAMLADIADALENHSPIDGFDAWADEHGVLIWE